MKTRDVVLQICSTLNITNTQANTSGVSTSRRDDIILNIVEALNQIILESPNLSSFEEQIMINPGAFADDPSGFYSTCDISNTIGKRIVYTSRLQYVWSGGSIKQTGSADLTNAEDIYCQSGCTNLRALPSLFAVDYPNQKLLVFPLLVQGIIQQFQLWGKSVPNQIEAFLDNDIRYAPKTTGILNNVVKTGRVQLKKGLNNPSPVPDYIVFEPDTMGFLMDSRYRSYIVYKTAILVAPWLAIPVNPDWELFADEAKGALLQNNTSTLIRHKMSNRPHARINADQQALAILGGAPLSRFIYG